MGREEAEAKRQKKLDELKKAYDKKNKVVKKKPQVKKKNLTPMDRESVEKRRMTKLEQQRVLRNKKGVKGRGDGTTMGGPNMFNALEKQAVKLKKTDSRKFNALMKKIEGMVGMNMGGMMNKKKMGYMSGGQSKLDKNKDGKISGADFKMMNKGGMSKKGKSGYMYGGMTKKKKK